MKNEFYYINLTDDERTTIVDALIIKRNILISQGKFTYLVDDVITKLYNAKKRNFKVKAG